MIVLDADVLMMDFCYPNDPNYRANRAFLDALIAHKLAVGMTTQGLLEVVGKRSYQTPTAAIPQLPAAIASHYGLALIPDSATVPDYAGCSCAEVLTQIATQMSLGDAVMAVQIAKFAPTATALVTWNARHFRNKVVVPVLTPAEWLQQQTPPTGPTP